MNRLSAALSIPAPTEAMPTCLRKASGTDRERYRMHKVNAKTRGIPFLFTFEEWIGWWQATGHYHEYGRQRGQYVMARKGDQGAYEPGNVDCMVAGDNSTAPHRGKPKSNEWKQKMRNTLATKKIGEPNG